MDATTANDSLKSLPWTQKVPFGKEANENWETCRTVLNQMISDEKRAIYSKNDDASLLYGQIKMPSVQRTDEEKNLFGRRRLRDEILD